MNGQESSTCAMCFSFRYCSIGSCFALVGRYRTCVGIQEWARGGSRTRSCSTPRRRDRLWDCGRSRTRSCSTPRRRDLLWDWSRTMIRWSWEMCRTAGRQTSRCLRRDIWITTIVPRATVDIRDRLRLVLSLRRHKLWSHVSWIWLTLRSFCILCAWKSVGFDCAVPGDLCVIVRH